VYANFTTGAYFKSRAESTPSRPQRSIERFLKEVGRFRVGGFTVEGFTVEGFTVEGFTVEGFTVHGWEVPIPARTVNPEPLNL
jgi:hypothetical protein